MNIVARGLAVLAVIVECVLAVVGAVVLAVIAVVLWVPWRVATLGYAILASGFVMAVQYGLRAVRDR